MQYETGPLCVKECPLYAEQACSVWNGQTLSGQLDLVHTMPGPHSVWYRVVPVLTKWESGLVHTEWTGDPVQIEWSRSIQDRAEWASSTKYVLGPHRGGLFLHRVGPVQWSTQVRVDPVRRKRARYSVHTARMYLPPWRESMFPRFLSSICHPLAKVSSTPLAQPRRVRFEILSATFVNIGMRMTFKHTKHFSGFWVRTQTGRLTPGGVWTPDLPRGRHIKLRHNGATLSDNKKSKKFKDIYVFCVVRANQ